MAACSGVGQFASGDGDWAAQFTGGVDPFPRDALDGGKGLGFCATVGHASREFGNLGEEGLVGVAPVNDDFVLHLSVLWGEAVARDNVSDLLDLVRLGLAAGQRLQVY